MSINPQRRLMRALKSGLAVLLSAAVMVVWAAPTPSVQGAADSGVVTRWLKENALPLFSLVPGAPFDDLEPLRATLANVSIVGLGEATHGTREFFTVKHRLIEFLVRECGFTAVALEAQFMKCLAVNAYIQDGSSTADPADVVRENLPGIYQTEEVLDLVRWMHDYNRTVPPERRVSFYGMDVQTPHRAAEAVLAYVSRVAPERVAETKQLVAETAPPEFRQYWMQYSRRPAARKARLRARLLELAGFLAVHRVRFVRATSAAEFETAVTAARILVQSHDIRSIPDMGSQSETDSRDGYMAESVEYLLDRQPAGGKLVVWAHNAHVWTRSREGVSSRDAGVRRELSAAGLQFKPMGSYLREVYGLRYYAVGLVFDSGSFQAIPAEAGDESMEPEEFELGPSPPGSAGWLMANAGAGDFILDLRSGSPEGAVAGWLDSPRRFRYAGADFSRKWSEPDFSMPIVPREQFDGMLFIRRTTRARPLQTGGPGPGR